MPFAKLFRRLTSGRARAYLHATDLASKPRRVSKWLRCKSCGADIAKPGETLRANWSIFCSCGRMVMPVDIQGCLNPDVVLKTEGAL
jgi:hypothetical protein